MLFLAALLFPILLGGLVLAMERVEHPVQDSLVGHKVVVALNVSPADEVERMVAMQSADALDRHWRRQARSGRRAVVPDGEQRRSA